MSTVNFSWVGADAYEAQPAPVTFSFEPLPPPELGPDDLLSSGQATTETEAAYFWRAVVEDEAAAEAETFVDAYPLIVERATATDERTPSTLRTRELTETANASELLQPGAAESVESAAAATEELTGTAFKLVVEQAQATDERELTTVRTRDVTDSAQATGFAVLTFDAVVEAEAAASSAVFESSDTVVTAEAAASSEVFDGIGRDADTVSTASASDEMVAHVVSQPSVTDTAVATDQLLAKLPGAIAWVLNTETAAASWYSNWQLVDMVQVGERVLGVGPEGLLELGAGSDAGEEIDAEIDWGFLEFGGYDQYGQSKESPLKKRVDGFIFGYNSDDVLEVSVETYGQGEPVYTYTMEARQAELSRTNRVKPGKGLSARYWRVAVKNVAGCDFDVDSFAADVVESRRRL